MKRSDATFRATLRVDVMLPPLRMRGSEPRAAAKVSASSADAVAVPPAPGPLHRNVPAKAVSTSTDVRNARSCGERVVRASVTDVRPPWSVRRAELRRPRALTRVLRAAARCTTCSIARPIPR